jgi:hypothetical protein
MAIARNAMLIGARLYREKKQREYPCDVCDKIIL